MTGGRGCSLPRRGGRDVFGRSGEVLARAAGAEFQRLGDRGSKADVRVIAATTAISLRPSLGATSVRTSTIACVSSRSLCPRFAKGNEDILPLAEAFLDEIGKTVARPCAGISKEARDALLTHSWPGNVRELRNAIERAIILCDGGLITAEHLPPPRAGNGPGVWGPQGPH